MSNDIKRRGRKKTNPANPKDNRISFVNQKIDLGDNVVFFDGKYNPERKELKVYKYHGDINRSKEAFKTFCSTYEGFPPIEEITVITKFTLY